MVLVPTPDHFSAQAHATDRQPYLRNEVDGCGLRIFFFVDPVFVNGKSINLWTFSSSQVWQKVARFDERCHQDIIRH